MATKQASPIPHEIARQLCETVQEENLNRRWSFGGLWCASCRKFSGGDVDKMCWRGKGDNRGCYQVTSRYDATL